MRDDALPRLRHRSPVSGLAWRRLGPHEVFAQSVSGAAPSGAMAATPAIVAVSAGDGTVWSFVIATVLALLIAGCITRFTRRMAAPGGLYSLTAKGLTPGCAFAAALAVLVGYGLLSAATLAGIAVYLDSLIQRVTGHVPAAVTSSAIVIVVSLVAGGFVLRGVRLSARVVLIVESASILLMLGVFGLLMIGTWAAGAPPPPGTAGAPADLRGVIAGVLPALAAFIGFEIAISLGAEARHPFRSIPRAVASTAALAGVLYIFAAHVQVIGFATTPGGLAAQPQPVLVLASARGWSWLPVLLDVGLVMSFFACHLAASTALARVLFSLARDGVAPGVLGRTHHRFRTPHTALAWSLPLTTGVLVALMLAGVAPGTALVLLLTQATCGFLLAYLSVCVAAPFFLHRIGELTANAVLVSAVIVPVLVVVLVAFVLTAAPAAYLLAGLAGIWLTGYLLLRYRHADALRDIGVYDETTTADALLHPRRAA